MSSLTAFEDKKLESNEISASSTNRPMKMNKALIKLKLLNLLKDLNNRDKDEVDSAFENELLSFIDQVLGQVDQENSEIMDILMLLPNFSIQMNNSLALINKIIKYFIIDKKNKDLLLDINQQDQQGNTPLHLASYLNRFDVCNLLLTEYKNIVNDTITNNNNLQALELTNNFKLYTLMVNLRNEYIKEVASELKMAFNNRDFEHLNDILIENPRNKALLDINGIDPSTGDTVLIEFIKKGDIVMCDWILKVGQADPFSRNDLGMLPKAYIQELIQFGYIKTTKSPTNSNSVTTNQAIGKELLKILDNAAKNQTMINLIQPATSDQRALQKLETSEKDKNVDAEHKKISVAPSIPQEIVEPPIMQGYLKKWTNFATGYKLRYFILNPKEGKLSYYKNKKDLWNCRGSLDLRFCYVYLNCSEGLKFEITTHLNQNTVPGTVTAPDKLDLSEAKLPHEAEGPDGSLDNSILQGQLNNNTITWHLKGNHPVETNKWVWCIQGAIRYCKDKDLEISSLNKSESISAVNTGSRKVGIVSRKASVNSGAKNEQEFHSFENGNDISLANVSTNSANLSSLPELSMKHGKKKKIELPSFQKKNVGELQGSALQLSLMSSATSDSDDYESEDDIHVGEDGISDFEDELNDEVLLKIQKNWVQLDNSIVLELNNLIDLMKNMDSSESNMTILQTLKSLKSSQELMNSEHHKMVLKNEKIVNKLNKILKLWIQSVKELEFELINKDDRIEKLQNDIKQLRKQGSIENRSESFLKSDAAAHNKGAMLENVIVAPSDKGKSADISDSVVDKDSETIQLAPAQSGKNNKAGNVSGSGDEYLSSDDEFFDFDDFEDESKPIPAVIQQQTSKENREPEEKVSEMVVLPEISGELKVDENLKKQVLDLIEKYNSNATRDDAKIPQETVALFNDNELNRFLHILKDQSFDGYEEGPRLKLKLSADERPKISLWSVLKSMIGKDMTKMSLPVTFNEPTSLLQRVVEDMEYVEILDKASTFYQSSTLRLLYVAIFSVSPYASTQGRIAKPFNPLLGETYEFVEPWKNYRCICEQVSHHPPIGAIYMDSPTWEYYGESNVDGNFNGRCFDFKHLGKWFINLKYGLNNEEELYSFKKPNNQVIGILTGNPQVDNYGEMELVNHTNGDKCVVTFKARGWRSNHAYEVKGEVFNNKGEKEWIFGGHWNSEIYAKRCTKSSKDDQDLIKSANIKNTDVKFDGSKFLVWKVNKRPDSPFNLTQFAIQLNALPSHLVNHLPKTDTRLRPDQKCMEDGLYDKAASEKHRVEEKQRAARKDRAAKKLDWEPSWFKQDTHPVTKDPYWRYTDEYWQRRKAGKWDDKCPDIF